VSQLETVSEWLDSSGDPENGRSVSAGKISVSPKRRPMFAETRFEYRYRGLKPSI
jgi:hypothetical protein